MALAIPMCGPLGMQGPSSLACGQVALKELNDGDGINGRPVELVLVDAADEAAIPVETVIDTLIDTGDIDAVVGMHISSVRQRLAQGIRGRVPFVYTPLYEGGEVTPGVFAIGDTPSRQLAPAIDYMSRTFGLRKWALIGNDYIWPRASHAYAKRLLRHGQRELVFEEYLPFGSVALEEAVERIGRSGADAILMSLIGQTAVDFNRLFGAAGLHDRMFRLSCCIEENGLLASGERNLDRLFAASSYFARLDTEANVRFRARYHARHPQRAPMLNALGQSIYEGMHFLADLLRDQRDDWLLPGHRRTVPIAYKSVRQGRYISNTLNRAPIYLARANGFVFDTISRLS